MAEGSIITEELQKLIGVPWEPKIIKIEEGAIQRYAEAIGDPNPLYNNVEYAQKSKHGRLMCPPGFTGWAVKEARMLGFEVTDTLIDNGAPPLPMDGGIEFEFFLPIGAGDTLVATTKITNITERETKSGKMLFSQAETTYLNLNGEVALKHVATYINRYPAS